MKACRFIKMSIWILIVLLVGTCITGCSNESTIEALQTDNEKTTIEEVPTSEAEPVIEEKNIVELDESDVKIWLASDMPSAFQDSVEYIDKEKLNEIMVEAIRFDAPLCAELFYDSGATIPTQIDGSSLYDYSLENNSGVGVKYAVTVLKQEEPKYQDLCTAVRNTNYSSAIALIECGVNPSEIGAEGYTLYHELLYENSIMTMGNSVYAHNYYNGLACMAEDDMAGYRQHCLNQSMLSKLISYCVENNVDWNAQNIYGDVACTDTMSLGSNVVLALLQNGIIQLDAEEVFSIAVRDLDPDLLKRAIDSGIDINGNVAGKYLSDCVSPSKSSAISFLSYFFDSLNANGYTFATPVGDCDEPTMLHYFLTTLVRPGLAKVYLGPNGEGSEVLQEMVDRLIEVTPSELIDYQYDDGSTLLFRLLVEEANMEMLGHAVYSNYFGSTVSEESSQFVAEILKKLVDAGANPNPIIGDTYAMQLISTASYGEMEDYYGNYDYAPIVKSYKEIAGLH
ncbi:MAG: hypothetical protein MJ194_04795 [Clostridia bacterium]|nr:hypothetical protein [Clostridia bacterium]